MVLPATDPAPPSALVLIVDDDTRLSDLLQRFLGENGFQTVAVQSADAAREKLEQLAFDILIVDVMMPGESGIDLVRSLRNEQDVPILFLTALGETDDRIAGLEVGADDYLVKPFDPRELVLRLRTILRRTAAVPPTPLSDSDALESDAAQFGPFRFDSKRRLLTRNGDAIYLTSGEADLLVALVANAGQPLAREDLAPDDRATITDRAIDVAITRLRKKIETDPKFPRYLQTIRGKGYVLHLD
ncbi:chemotaxis protein CheY [Elstera litoralis]|uniref:Chemotaxis protein CheY n=1 Tax=Elstera litoralis TaxID=552518 RepID=A0A0F3IR70_9PROT|nr:response regulator [Elstera litoralis]KJV09211.1 chemotaxis protein CheY [Elstera litoralis]